jgi:hypothetical protein
MMVIRRRSRRLLKQQLKQSQNWSHCDQVRRQPSGLSRLLLDDGA